MEQDGKAQCVRPSTYVYIFVVEGPEHIEKTTWGLMAHGGPSERYESL
jgi:hypothetical protein